MVQSSTAEKSAVPCSHVSFNSVIVKILMLLDLPPEVLGEMIPERTFVSRDLLPLPLPQIPLLGRGLVESPHIYIANLLLTQGLSEDFQCK